MRRKGIRGVALLAVTLLVVALLAVSPQARPALGSESLWNMEGLGRPLEGYDYAARGAGGTAIAAGDPFGLSFVNPAAIAHAKLPQGQFALVGQNRWIRAEGQPSGSRRFDARLTAVRAVVPGPGILRWGIGYTDLTDGAYRARFRVNAGREDEYLRTLTGRGGVGEFSAALAARLPGGRVAAGVHLGLANGTLQDAAEDQFVGSGYLNSQSRLRTRVENGHVLGAGLQVRVRPDLAVGACYRRAAHVDLKAIWLLSGGAQWQETASFELPAESGLGVAWSVLPRLRLAADWNHTAWTASDFRLRTSTAAAALATQAGAADRGFGSLHDTDRVGAGITLLPVSADAKVPLLRRTVWRAGFSTGELPGLQRGSGSGVSGPAVREWALTAGAGIPIQVDRGFVDLLLEVGRTGNLGAVGLRESFVRLGVGVSFGRFAEKY